MEMILTEFYSRVNKARDDNHRWRYGQAAFNVLQEMRPELAERIRATDLDPFYFDRWEPTLQRFHEWLEKNWSTSEK